MAVDLYSPESRLGVTSMPEDWSYLVRDVGSHLPRLLFPACILTGATFPDEKKESSISIAPSMETASPASATCVNCHRQPLLVMFFDLFEHSIRPYSGFSHDFPPTFLFLFRDSQSRVLSFRTVLSGKSPTTDASSVAKLRQP